MDGDTKKLLKLQLLSSIDSIQVFKSGVYKVPSSGYHVFRTVPNFLPISRSDRKSGEGISEFFIKNFKNFISKLKILGS